MYYCQHVLEIYLLSKQQNIPIWVAYLALICSRPTDKLYTFSYLCLVWQKIICFKNSLRRDCRWMSHALNMVFLTVFKFVVIKAYSICKCLVFLCTIISPVASPAFHALILIQGIKFLVVDFFNTALTIVECYLWAISSCYSDKLFLPFLYPLRIYGREFQKLCQFLLCIFQKICVWRYLGFR